jgi:hypothetical protein
MHASAFGLFSPAPPPPPPLSSDAVDARVHSRGISRADLEETIGIHPTSAEEALTLHITKRSGVDAKKTGC